MCVREYTWVCACATSTKKVAHNNIVHQNISNITHRPEITWEEAKLYTPQSLLSVHSLPDTSQSQDKLWPSHTPSLCQDGGGFHWSGEARVHLQETHINQACCIQGKTIHFAGRKLLMKLHHTSQFDPPPFSNENLVLGRKTMYGRELTLASSEPHLY